MWMQNPKMAERWEKKHVESPKPSEESKEKTEEVKESSFRRN